MTTGKRTAAGSFLLVVMFALCSLMTLPDRECAAWSDDPAVNTPVCTASGNQLLPTIIRGRFRRRHYYLERRSQQRLGHLCPAAQFIRCA